METKFKAGQEVWYLDSNLEVIKSSIKKISNREDYPIELESGALFTLDGKYNVNDKFPTLSTTPFTIELKGYSQEPQEILPEKDTLVWVRNRNDSRWEVRFFSHKKRDLYYCFEYQLKSNETTHTTAWKEMSIECPLK